MEGHYCSTFKAAVEEVTEPNQRLCKEGELAEQDTSCFRCRCVTRHTGFVSRTPTCFLKSHTGVTLWYTHDGSFFTAILQTKYLALGHFSSAHFWWCTGFKALKYLNILVEGCFPQTLEQPASRTLDITGQRPVGVKPTKKPEILPLEMAEMILTYLYTLPSFMPPVY